jgi:hypothetical protein
MTDTDTLLTKLRALLEEYAPQRRENYTRRQLAAAEGYSLSTYHKLKRMGLGPEEQRIPGLALTRITHDARLKWRARLNQLAAADADAHEAKHAALVEKRREAGHKAADSPRHISKRKKQTSKKK